MPRPPPTAAVLTLTRHSRRCVVRESWGLSRPEETQDIIAKEWAAGSSAADGYVRDTAMGYDNLRTLSLGITGHLLGDIGRSASTASVELGHLQREREKVEGE